MIPSAPTISCSFGNRRLTLDAVDSTIIASGSIALRKNNHTVNRSQPQLVHHRFDQWLEAASAEIEASACRDEQLFQTDAPAEAQSFSVGGKSGGGIFQRSMPNHQCPELRDAVLDIIEWIAEERSEERRVGKECRSR